MKMIPTSVRIREDDLAKLAAASEATETPQADLIRLALKIGMASLEKIGFNPDAIIMAKVEELESADTLAKSVLARTSPRPLSANR